MREIRVGMCGEGAKSWSGVIVLVKLRSTALVIYGRSGVIPFPDDVYSRASVAYRFVHT
jgi:uncharacterized membrane protein